MSAVTEGPSEPVCERVSQKGQSTRHSNNEALIEAQTLDCHLPLSHVESLPLSLLLIAEQAAGRAARVSPPEDRAQQRVQASQNVHQRVVGRSATADRERE